MKNQSELRPRQGISNGKMKRSDDEGDPANNNNNRVSTINPSVVPNEENQQSLSEPRNIPMYLIEVRYNDPDFNAFQSMDVLAYNLSAEQANEVNGLGRHNFSNGGIPSNYYYYNNLTMDETIRFIIKTYRSVYSWMIPLFWSILFIALTCNIFILISSRWLRSNLSPNLRLCISLAGSDAWTSFLQFIGLGINGYIPYVLGFSQFQRRHKCYLVIFELVRISAMITSDLHLLALAANHCYSIAYPLQSRIVLTSIRCKAFIISLWLVPFSSLAIFFTFHSGGLLTKGCPFPYYYEFPFRLVIFTVFSVPLLLTFIIYGYVLQKLLTSPSSVHSSIISSSSAAAAAVSKPSKLTINNNHQNHHPSSPSSSFTQQQQELNNRQKKTGTSRSSTNYQSAFVSTAITPAKQTSSNRSSSSNKPENRNSSTTKTLSSSSYRFGAFKTTGSSERTVDSNSASNTTTKRKRFPSTLAKTKAYSQFPVVHKQQKQRGSHPEAASRRGQEATVVMDDRGGSTCSGGGSGDGRQSPFEAFVERHRRLSQRRMRRSVRIQRPLSSGSVTQTIRTNSCRRGLRNKLKAVWTTLLIVGTFTCSWFPAVLWFLLYCKKGCAFTLKDVHFRIALVIGSTVNSLIMIKLLANPLIYGYRISEIRFALGRMWHSRFGAKTSFFDSRRSFCSGPSNNNYFNPIDSRKESVHISRKYSDPVYRKLSANCSMAASTTNPPNSNASKNRSTGNTHSLSLHKMILQSKSVGPEMSVRLNSKNPTAYTNNSTIPSTNSVEASSTVHQYGTGAKHQEPHKFVMKQNRKKTTGIGVSFKTTTPIQHHNNRNHRRDGGLGAERSFSEKRETIL